MDDAMFMDEALALAAEAAAEGEVPVGCVIVRSGEIVGRGRNRREKDKTALGHGEIEAIEWKEKNIFGTQWHPEQTLHGMGDAIEHKFFENFLKRCEECKAKRS